MTIVNKQKHALETNDKKIELKKQTQEECQAHTIYRPRESIVTHAPSEQLRCLKTMTARLSYELELSPTTTIICIDSLVSRHKIWDT